MGILLGLSAAFWWGTSDFLAARVARGIGALRALLITQSFGLLAVGALISWQKSSFSITSQVGWMMLAIAITQAVSVFLFYRAFEIGQLSLVAPITSSFAVVTAILALLSGERPARLAIIGAACLIAGVFFVTRGHQPTEEAGIDGSTKGAAPLNNLRGVPEAIIAAVGYGFVFWGLDSVVPTMGVLWPLAFMRIMVLICLSAALLGMRFSTRATPPSMATWRAMILPSLAVAGADTLAWLSFNSGTQRDDVAIVTTLGSLYSGFAVFFAWLIWKEKLQKTQWLGVAIIFLGIILVGIG